MGSTGGDGRDEMRQNGNGDDPRERKREGRYRSGTAERSEIGRAHV